MISKIGGFTIGVALSCTFVAKMDDMMYSQLKKHIIYPVQILALNSK
jgi:hypothetical protein